MSLQTEFKEHYKTLGLAPDADWKQVQASYRQLLIRWHPDRHRHNSTLHEHATTHFIGLTTAFNELRNFQRQHNRLPLQSGLVEGIGTVDINPPAQQRDATSASAAAARAPGAGAKNQTTNNSAINRHSKAAPDRPARDGGAGKEKRRSTQQTVSTSLDEKVAKPVNGVSYSTFQLSDEQLQKASLVGGSSKPGLFNKLKTLLGQRQYQMAGVIVGLTLIVILLVVVLDKTNSNWRQNEASRIVIESGVSEFVRPADDILRGRSNEDNK